MVWKMKLPPPGPRPRRRVRELAKDLDVPVEQVLAILHEIGEFVSSPSSHVEEPVVAKVYERCGRPYVAQTGEPVSGWEYPTSIPGATLSRQHHILVRLTPRKNHDGTLWRTKVTVGLSHSVRTPRMRSHTRAGSSLGSARLIVMYGSTPGCDQGKPRWRQLCETPGCDRVIFSEKLTGGPCLTA